MKVTLHRICSCSGRITFSPAVAHSVGALHQQIQHLPLAFVVPVPTKHQARQVPPRLLPEAASVALDKEDDPRFALENAQAPETREEP